MAIAVNVAALPSDSLPFYSAIGTLHISPRIITTAGIDSFLPLGIELLSYLYIVGPQGTIS